MQPLTRTADITARTHDAWSVPGLAPTTYAAPGASTGSGERAGDGRIGRAKLALVGAPTVPEAWRVRTRPGSLGVRMVVLHGDPTRRELVLARCRLPHGYGLATGAHPSSEHISVISGMLEVVDLGEGSERATSLILRACDCTAVPALQPHVAIARGVTVVQLNAMGPFDLTYVMPRPLAPSAGR